MSLSDKHLETIRREWRELGFHYDRDDAAREWRLTGSSQGLGAFAKALRTLATSKRANDLSEHDHLGPYWYLEIGIWTEPEITDHWIAGPAKDLLILVEKIEALLVKHPVGATLYFGQEFAPHSPYDLVLNIAEDGFDPASIDDALRTLHEGS